MFIDELIGELIQWKQEHLDVLKYRRKYWYFASVDHDSFSFRDDKLFQVRVSEFSVLSAALYFA